MSNPIIDAQQEIYEATVALTKAVIAGSVSPENLTFENACKIVFIGANGEIDGKAVSEEIVANPVLYFTK